MAHDNGIRRAVRWLMVTTILSLLSVTATAESFRLAPAQASYRLVVNGLPLGLERIYAKGNQRTELWVATDLNYFMVRMDHAENLFIRGRIELTDHGLLQAAKTLSRR